MKRSRLGLRIDGTAATGSGAGWAARRAPGRAPAQPASPVPARAPGAERERARQQPLAVRPVEPARGRAWFQGRVLAPQPARRLVPECSGRTQAAVSHRGRSRRAEPNRLFERVTISRGKTPQVHRPRQDRSVWPSAKNPESRRARATSSPTFRRTHGGSPARAASAS